MAGQRLTGPNINPWLLIMNSSVQRSPIGKSRKSSEICYDLCLEIVASECYSSRAVALGTVTISASVLATFFAIVPMGEP